MAQLTILHENAYALLVRIGDQEQWLSREAVKHYLNGNHIPDKLAQSLTNNHIGTCDLAWLIEEMKLHNLISIKPKPNQLQQQAAFEKLYDLKVFALMMQMRSGKTKVAIDIICNHFANGVIDVVLWLCPLSALATAQEQWDKFAVCDVPKKLVGLETISSCSTQNFIKISQSIKGRYAVIIDESQMIKNTRAKRSRRIESLLNRATIKGILSGTPITRNIQDIYNQARVLDWRILGYRNIWQFRNAHLIMSDKYPGLIRDTKDVDYLVNRLEPFSFEWFISYNSVKNQQYIWVDMSDAQRKYYEQIKRVALDRLSSYTERPAEIYTMFTALQSVLSGYISAPLMQWLLGKQAQAILLDTPKLTALMDYVGRLGKQKIIWCARLHEINSIKEKLGDCIIVSGDIPPKERHERIQAFRNSQNGTLVAMMQVAKRAIEISECNEVIYYGHSFDFESKQQSQWRTLLPNKIDICRYTDIVYDNSLDGRIMAAHRKKQNVINEFFKLLKQNRKQALTVLEHL